MKTNDRIKQQRNRHNAALLMLANSLNPENNLSGLQLWRKLRQIEAVAHAAATAYCNGERITLRFPKCGRYLPLPFEYKGDTDGWERVVTVATDCVYNVLGAVPPAFRVNGDARGHALRLDSGNDEKPATPFALEQDWGRNQILAPTID